LERLEKLGQIRPTWDNSIENYLAFGPFVVEDSFRSYIAMYLRAIKREDGGFVLGWFDNEKVIEKSVLGNPAIGNNEISFSVAQLKGAPQNYLIRPLLSEDHKLFKLAPDVDIHQYALQVFQPRTY
jgi:hypothetical protein